MKRHLSNKFLSILLIVFLVLGMLPVSATTNGTDANPYLISTAEELVKLAEQVNSGNSSYMSKSYKKSYRLTKDIDLSAYGKNYNGGKGWKPIGIGNTGDNLDRAFHGSFDGSGHKITGLYINSNSNYLGLFGLVDQATIKNLTIEKANITGGDEVGGVVGYIPAGYEGAIAENCSFTGSIHGKDYVGGIVGDMLTGTIENCLSAGSISGNQQIGGVAGDAAYGTLKTCNFTGSITGNDNVGGIVGCAFLNIKVENCRSSSVITSTGGAGGISGNVLGIIRNCYSTGEVAGKNYVGGVSGGITGGTVQDCYSSSKVTGSEKVGGVAGSVNDSYGGKVQNCVALNSSVNGINDVGRIIGVVSMTYTTSNNIGNFLFNNYASKDVKVNNNSNINGLANDINGESFTISQTPPAFWADKVKWDSSIWTFANGKLPVLKAGSFTIDTGSYTMAPGNIYQIGAKATGMKSIAVQCYSSVSGVASVTKLKNGNYQIKGIKPGTTYIMFDIIKGKTKVGHLSMRVDVKKGVKQGGQPKVQTISWD